MNKHYLKLMFKDEANRFYGDITRDIDLHRFDNISKRDGYEFCRRTYFMRPEHPFDLSEELDEDGFPKRIYDETRMVAAIRLPRSN